MCFDSCPCNHRPDEDTEDFLTSGAPSRLSSPRLQPQANTRLLSVTEDEFHTHGIAHFVFLSVSGSFALHNDFEDAFMLCVSVNKFVFIAE